MQLLTRKFTTQQYHQMAETGIFHPQENLELIQGEIITLSPVGFRHAFVTYDREIKIPLYAQYQIPEVWLINLSQKQLERYTEGRSGKYQTIDIFNASRTIKPLAFPSLELRLDKIFK